MIHIKKYLIIAFTGILFTACTSSNNINNTIGIEKIVDIKIEKHEINNDNLEDVELTTELIKDEVEIMCEKVREMDFIVKKPHLNITAETDLLYKKAYLKILKNEISTTNYKNEKEYFRDLYGAGTEFENLYERYTFYYNDLDGDGLPELAIKHGYTYILKYYPKSNDFDVLYSGASMYVKLMGVGQIWYHDGLHAGVIRDRLIVLNQDNEWEIILDLQQGIDAIPFYEVGTNLFNSVDVGKVNWDEITTPFFNMTKDIISFQTLEDVFGESLF